MKSQSKEAKTVIDARGKKVQKLEAATFKERAAHAKELRELLQELRKQTPHMIVHPHQLNL